MVQEPILLGKLPLAAATLELVPDEENAFQLSVGKKVVVLKGGSSDDIPFHHCPRGKSR
jgi:hypothetical protein